MHTKRLDRPNVNVSTVLSLSLPFYIFNVIIVLFSRLLTPFGHCCMDPIRFNVSRYNKGVHLYECVVITPWDTTFQASGIGLPVLSPPINHSFKIDPLLSVYLNHHQSTLLSPFQSGNLAICIHLWFSFSSSISIHCLSLSSTMRITIGLLLLLLLLLINITNITRFAFNLEFNEYSTLIGSFDRVIIVVHKSI